MATTQPMIENEINLTGKDFDRLVGGMYAEAFSFGGVSVFQRPEMVGFNSKGVNVEAMMAWVMGTQEGKRLVVVYASHRGISNSILVGKAAVSAWYKEEIPAGDWLPVFGEAEDNLEKMIKEHHA